MSTSFEEWSQEVEAGLSPAGKAMSKAYQEYYGEELAKLQNVASEQD